MATSDKGQKPTRPEFPSDFPQRIEVFKEESGLSWRALAKRLGVRPYRLRQWRRGIRPDTRNLLHLVTVANGMGLLRVLLSADDGTVSGCSGAHELRRDPSPDPQRVENEV